MQMTGNTILITGGSSGIGRALAEALHKEGNKVIVAGRRRTLLDEVTAKNPGMQSAVLDVQDQASLDAFVAGVPQNFPALNILINNAGIMKPENLNDSAVDPGVVEATVMTNLIAPLRLTTELLPLLKKQPHATVMTVSSWARGSGERAEPELMDVFHEQRMVVADQPGAACLLGRQHSERRVEQLPE